MKPRQGRSRCSGGESGQGIDHARRAAGDHLQALAQQQQVGVVGHVAARGAQVDDRPGLGALVAVGVDVGHHVVPQLSLVLGGRLEVDVVDVAAELLDLPGGDRQAQFRLGLGQRHPQPPPGAELPPRAPKRAHLRRSIAGNERVVVLGALRGRRRLHRVVLRTPETSHAMAPLYVNES